jgi:hypothetical protein
MEKGSRRACSSSALSASRNDVVTGRVVEGARGDKVKTELRSDNRRKVNDGSECLCGNGGLMVSAWNVVVVAVGNWDDAEGSEATSTRKECGE